MLKANEAHEIAVKKDTEGKQLLEQMIPYILQHIHLEIESSAANGDFYCYISLLDAGSTALKAIDVHSYKNNYDPTFDSKDVRRYCLSPIKKSLKHIGYRVSIRRFLEDFIIKVSW